MESRKSLVFLGGLFIGMIALSRLVDHPANFAPIGAVAILSAYYLKSKYSWVLALGAMLTADLFLGFYQWQVMLAVYGSYLAMWGLGRYAKTQETRWALAPMTLLGSSLHFILTNFAVWAFTGLYAKTMTGLLMAYTMAVPFFKWTVAGDVFYAVLFVSAIEGARFVAKRSVGGESVAISS